MPATAACRVERGARRPSVRRMAPSTPGRSSSSSAAAAPRMTAALARASASRAVPGEDRRLDDVGRGRTRRSADRSGGGVAAVAHPAMDAGPRRREPEPAVRRPRSDPTSRARPRGRDRRARGSATPNRPALARAPSRIATSPSASTTAAGMPSSRVERAVGQPALGDAVEVETESRRATDATRRAAVGPATRTARSTGRRVPAPSPAPSAVPPRAGRRGARRRRSRRSGPRPSGAQSRIAASVGRTGTSARGSRVERDSARTSSANRVRRSAQAAIRRRIDRPSGSARRGVRPAVGRSEVDPDRAAHQGARCRDDGGRLVSRPAGRRTTVWAGGSYGRPSRRRSWLGARLAGRDDDDAGLWAPAPAGRPPRAARSGRAGAGRSG